MANYLAVLWNFFANKSIHEHKQEKDCKTKENIVFPSMVFYFFKATVTPRFLKSGAKIPKGVNILIGPFSYQEYIPELGLRVLLHWVDIMFVVILELPYLFCTLLSIFPTVLAQCMCFWAAARLTKFQMPLP